MLYSSFSILFYLLFTSLLLLTISFSEEPYFKCCGQEFWELITGEEDFYKTLIEPLGEKAKEHNEAFLEQYTLMLNKLVAEFSKEYVDKQGRINWDAILELNSKKFYEKL